MPRELPAEALLIGIVLALIIRGIFIAVGAAAINQFSWVFYIFGAFLVYTAVNLAARGRRRRGRSTTRTALVRFVRAPPAVHRDLERRQAHRAARTASG